MPQPDEKPRALWTDSEFILAHGQEAREKGRPIRLGRFQRDGWNGPLALYLIWCPSCRVRPNGGFTVTHEAGYERRLECGSCSARYDHLLPSRRIKDHALNPHHHPWLIAFLVLIVILIALATR